LFYREDFHVNCFMGYTSCRNLSKIIQNQ
jgi:hypothetical protein